MNKQKVEGVETENGQSKRKCFTTFNVKEKYMPKDILKLTPFLIGLSICENLNKIAKEKFCIKWPNDVLCSEHFKVCVILVDKYKGKRVKK